MNDRVDHKVEAERWLRSVAEIVNDADDSGDVKGIETVLRHAAVWTPRAYAHASIAVAEQLKVANQIAYLRLVSSPIDATDLAQAQLDKVQCAYLEVLPEIRKGLGLS